jgi:hypothetical protein
MSCVVRSAMAAAVLMVVLLAVCAGYLLGHCYHFHLELDGRFIHAVSCHMGW